jgi:hypothetical protein
MDMFTIKKIEIPMWMKGMCNKTVKNQGAIRFLMVRDAKRLLQTRCFQPLAIGSGKRVEPEFK